MKQRLHAITIAGERWFIERVYVAPVDDDGTQCNLVVDPGSRRISVWQYAPEWDEAIYLAEAVAAIAVDAMGRLP